MSLGNQDGAPEPVGACEALSRFSHGLSLARFQAIRADRLQRVLLRVPRRGAGAIARDVTRGRRFRLMNASNLLFVNARQVVTCRGPARARRGAELGELEVLQDAAVATNGERIVGVGPRRDLEARFPDARRIDCEG